MELSSNCWPLYYEACELSDQEIERVYAEDKHRDKMATTFINVVKASPELQHLLSDMYGPMAT